MVSNQDDAFHVGGTSALKQFFGREARRCEIRYRLAFRQWIMLDVTRPDVAVRIDPALLVFWCFGCQPCRRDCCRSSRHEFSSRKCWTETPDVHYSILSDGVEIANRDYKRGTIPCASYCSCFACWLLCSAHR